MKILWCSDIHATGKSPNSRIDNYPITIQEKLIEIGEIAKEENVNFIIIGGDLFHIPVVANAYASEIAKIIRNWNKKVYVVPGNHDCSGYSISTIKHSTLGILESTGVINFITREKPIIGKLGNKIIALEGQEYCVGIDDDPSNYNKKIKADYNILFAHGMLVAKPIMDSIKHIVIDSITEPADITFSGHDHVGYGILNVNGNIFINNGSIGRTDCGSGMKKHKPSVIITTLENINGNIENEIKEINLKTAKDFYDVFKESSDTTLKDSFVNFVNTVRAVDNDDLKQDKFFDKLKSEEVVEEDTINKCKNYLDAAKIELDNSMVKSSSKIKETIYITKIELKNFLSHKDSIIEFDNGLNIILGENGCGKSSIFTAIQYVLFDTPKGTDFIRTGASSCEVKITFSNGTYIRKIRTKAKGTYYTFDGKKEEKFEGYANNLPKQIADIHQMPLVNLYKDKLVNLNYADQYEGLFLMGLSSSEKAEAIGIITGTDVVDEAINTVATDIRNLKTNAKSYEKEIATLMQKENELSEKYKEIEMLANIINTKYDFIKRLELVKKSYDDFNVANSLYDKEKSKRDVLSNKIEEANLLLENYIDYSKVTNDYLELKNSLNNVDNIVHKVSRINVFLNNLEPITGELSKDYTVAFNRYVDVYCCLNNINKVKSKIIDVSMYIDFYNSLPVVDNICDVFGEYSKLSSTYSNIKYNYNSTLNSIAMNEKSLYGIELKINELSNELSKIGVCPVCNKILDEDSINHILHKEGY